METLLLDLRYSIRTLLKTPGFSTVAIIALALGIGANTAIFSVFNAVLLRPLPYKDPAQLVMIYQSVPQKGDARRSVSPANFLDWKNQAQTFEQVAAFLPFAANLTGIGEPERVQGALVSASFFSLLGVEPILGRGFVTQEEQRGSHRVVVLSHGLWQRCFGADRDVLGKVMSLNGNGYTVIGVMPPNFDFAERALEQTEFWAPLALTAEQLTERRTYYLYVAARLKPGSTLKQAKLEMDMIAHQLEQQYPEANTGLGVEVVLLHEALIGDIRPALAILLGAVVFVLLIACANVANLLLSRATARQKEIAIRTALGASRIRLIRQLLTESTLLSLVGGVLGLLLSDWGIQLLTAASRSYIPRVGEVAIDVWVLSFTLGISLLTGIVLGIAPAWGASKPDINESLKEGGRGSMESSGRRRLRNLIVISEIALALVLLTGAGLMIKSFSRLQGVDLGFNPDHVLAMRIALPSYKYPTQQQEAAFFRQLLEQVKALPGINSAGAITDLPLSRWSTSVTFSVGGGSATSGQESTANSRQISPDYFRTLSIPLLKGRGISDQDNERSTKVVVINQSLARQFWHDEDPIGGKIILSDSSKTVLEIVGVVGDIRHRGPAEEIKPEIYVPYLQKPRSFLYLVARTDVDPLSLVPTIRSEVWAIDKDQPVTDVKTLEDFLSDAVSRPRLYALLLAVFAGLAIILAAVGIYGVMSYSVAQRTHEIGIRMALGAQPHDVLKLVVGQGMILAVIGIATGLVAAFALTRVVNSLLFQVSATDPTVFVGITLLLTMVVLLASYIPARRATRVDPIVVLRYE
jgi:putative ABC transport system permease protein